VKMGICLGHGRHGDFLAALVNLVGPQIGPDPWRQVDADGFERAQHGGH